MKQLWKMEDTRCVCGLSIRVLGIHDSCSGIKEGIRWSLQFGFTSWFWMQWCKLCVVGWIWCCRNINGPYVYRSSKAYGECTNWNSCYLEGKSWIREAVLLIFPPLLLYFRDRLIDSLLCPNQVWANNIDILDIPMQFDQQLTHSITISEEDHTIP